ncbi:MAG: hypothetical protein K0Q81_78 [Paenibacillus sp.]|nr:hypothetical protein [Paenibacillus sp.]
MSSAQTIYQSIWITTLIAIVIYIVRQMFKEDNSD